MGFSPANIGNAVGAQLTMKEPRGYNIVLVFHFLKTCLGTQLDFSSKLINKIMIITDNVQQDNPLLVHLLNTILELLFRSLVALLHVSDLALVVLHQV